MYTHYDQPFPEVQEPCTAKPIVLKIILSTKNSHFKSKFFISLCLMSTSALQGSSSYQTMEAQLTEQTEAKTIDTNNQKEGAKAVLWFWMDPGPQSCSFFDSHQQEGKFLPCTAPWLSAGQPHIQPMPENWGLKMFSHIFTFSITISRKVSFFEK